VDLPELQQEKMDKVTALLGGLPDRVTYVPVDFNTQRLEDALTASGYDDALRSFFNWEGVCYYLTAEGVDTTLAFVAGRAPRGSSIVFDYMPRSMVQGSRDYYGAHECREYMEQLGEVYTFGVEDGSTARFLAQRGFSVLSDVGPRELQRRYLVRSDGELHGRVLGFVRIVHARVERRANWSADGNGRQRRLAGAVVGR
jgi:methyltransferase (TIGR00027 family)